MLVAPNPVGVNDSLAVTGVEEAAEQHGGSQNVHRSPGSASIQ